MDSKEELALYYKDSFHTLHLNEMLSGQSKEFILGTFKLKQDTLDIDFSDYYICITGLKKKVYTGAFKIETDDYLEIYFKFREHIMAYLRKTGYSVEMTLYTYEFESKQIVLILSPGYCCCQCIDEVCRYINHYLQILYEERFLVKDSGYFNFTVISPHLKGFDQLAPQFKKGLKLGDLAYFFCRSMVLTERKLLSMKRPVSCETMQQQLDFLMEGILHGGCLEKVKDGIDQLFVLLGLSFDLEICSWVLAELNQQLNQFHLLFNIHQPHADYRLESFPNLTELQREVKAAFLKLFEGDQMKGKGTLHQVAKAKHYMMKNFTSNISLCDVASYVNVAPGYLSRIFNQEVKMSIPSYLTALRMERAKELLRHSNLKVGEVAKSVGMDNSHYFSLMFKKKLGVTPQQYRVSFDLSHK